MKKEKLKQKIKQQKAITLIALVVTIVVILILAGVTLNLVIGDNGIITKAKEAKTKYEEDAENTQISLNNLESELQNLIGNTTTGEGSEEVSSYTISYNSNEGTGTMSNQNKDVGESVTISSNSFTAPTGKGFKGWNTKADGTGTSYIEGASYSEDADLTLYAIWGYGECNENGTRKFYGQDGLSYTLTEDNYIMSGENYRFLTSGSLAASYYYNEYTSDGTFVCDGHYLHTGGAQ